MQDLLKCSDNYKHCESTVQNEENQLLKTINIQLSPPLDPEASEIHFVSDSTSIESADQLSVSSGSISLSDSEVIFLETESLNKELGPEIQDSAIKYSVTHNATDALLRILKPLHPELPSNARKLLETPRNIPISAMDTGEFIRGIFYNKDLVEVFMYTKLLKLIRSNQQEQMNPVTSQDVLQLQAVNTKVMTPISDDNEQNNSHESAGNCDD
ncbi:unnamed protein product [Allacma fusca]|uniref:Uncharacterized protein n=1 Tax=Allacma fusca TaxID=39272 RepID=A0A8J2L1T4_9HEXA|nr:unnamed protein product [Allacma fusca]